MMASFSPFLFSIILGAPTDLVSFLEPKSALEVLGEATDEAGLKRLIEGKPGAAAAGEALDEKAATTAVQNLASSSEQVRAKAREKLASLGEAVRARLEDVVKNDPRRAEEAKKVLAELDAASKASASRSGVSRLLAVRLAGDQKLAALAEPIRSLASSPDPFLKQAAAESLASIEGKKPPAPPERPWAKSLAAIEALPAGTNYLMDFPMDIVLPALAGTSVPRIDKVFKSFTEMLGPAEGGVLQQATRSVLDFAVKCGNARVDRVTFANVGLMARKSGIALILCGEYEPRLLEKGIQDFGSWKVEETGGKKVLVTADVRILLLDDHNVVLLFDNASDNFPLAEYVSAHASGSKPLRGDARWEKFFRTLGAAARGLVRMDASIAPPHAWDGLEREGVGAEVVAAAKAMKEIEAEAKPLDSKKISCRMEAEFEEAQHATAFAGFLKGKIAEGLAEVEGELAHMAGTPFEAMMKNVVDAMKSIKIAGEGKKGILRGELDPSVFLSFFVARSAPMQVR